MSEWISVKDRLPTEDGKYLIYAPSMDEEKPFVSVSWFDPDRPSWQFIPSVWNDSVTHWMPLPEPPKKPEEGHTLI